MCGLLTYQPQANEDDHEEVYVALAVAAGALMGTSAVQAVPLSVPTSSVVVSRSKGQLSPLLLAWRRTTVCVGA